ncbi:MULTISPECIES: TetR/AcrR family transcriptional regulator [Arthrobacter]|uniref:TetR/AcrR family transcriptional regulator n=1 Tax=Arthrobacter terricola TaxID=2547396 RepID=A0A4R5KBW8_9MICC|nr:MULTISPECIES: TetR/AcrR family transcriptional regulator [Arthrobacter]MBT8161735.1 TetR/AcrR family transcriptional regulator [Arthrobacter sp. GN70]TDF92693.1 TetR/AcrR family transcriptional regulator [Arthrobacter terricola]
MKTVQGPEILDTRGDARTLILDSAEDLIAEHGFKGTSTALIAKSAGVAKGLLFYYFPVKSDLLVALMAERLPAMPLDTDRLAIPGDPAAGLIGTLDALNLSDHKSIVLRVILWREADTHPTVRAQLRKFQTGLERDTAAVLRKCLPDIADAERIKACATAWVSAIFSSATDDRLSDLDGLPRRSKEQLKAIAFALAASLRGATAVLAS